MSENPPPYGDDRKDFEPPADMPVPPEMDAPPAPLPPSTSGRNPFTGAFIATTLVSAIPIIGILVGLLSILIGLIGAGTSKDPASRAKFGGAAAGGAVGIAVGLVITAGICASAFNSGGSGF